MVSVSRTFSRFPAPRSIDIVFRFRIGRVDDDGYGCANVIGFGFTLSERYLLIQIQKTT